MADGFCHFFQADIFSKSKTDLASLQYSSTHSKVYSGIRPAYFSVFESEYVTYFVFEKEVCIFFSFRHSFDNHFLKRFRSYFKVFENFLYCWCYRRRCMNLIVEGAT